MLNFPIQKDLPEIIKKILASSSLILTSSPGSGKTTFVPMELLSHFKKQIWVLEPRRVAALGAAHFAAQIAGSPLGALVGYQVRNDSQQTLDVTRLLYMTEGLFIKKLKQNPSLEGVDLVIIDEFHERNLETDLALGLLKELQELERPDLKIMVMSATLNPQPLISFLPQSIHHHSESQSFPCETQYSTKQLTTQLNELIERVVNAILSLPSTSNATLVFLPGVNEISLVKEKLLSKKFPHLIQELHGKLNLNKQKEVIQFSERKRVILSTNIAESSITIDGLDTVIDSGLERRDYWNQEFDLQSLELSRISQFSATQRKGRSHRQRPGLCLRLWSEAEDRSFLQSAPPAVQRVSLDSALVELSSLGHTQFPSFSWFEPPPKYALTFSESKLKRLKILSSEGELTQIGKEISLLPLPFFEATVFHEFAASQQKKMGAQVCALLTEREPDFWSVNPDESSDLEPRLEAFSRKASPQLQKIARELESIKIESQKPQQSLEDILIKTYLPFICVKERMGDLKAKSAQGYSVETACPVSKNSLYFFPLKTQLIENKLKVRWAHAIDPKHALSIMNEQSQTHTELVFNDETLSFQVVSQKFFFSLPLGQPFKKSPTSEELGTHLSDWTKKNWKKILDLNPHLNNFWDRVLFWSDHHKTDETQNLNSAISFLLEGKTDLNEILAHQFPESLFQLLSDDLKSQLNSQVPPTVRLKSKDAPIDYSDPLAPKISVQIHELYGSNGVFRVPLGSKPIMIDILGPHKRSVQRTTNLSQFWRGSYFDVKKELKADYPRHFWPDCPESAPPVRMKKDANKMH